MKVCSIPICQDTFISKKNEDKNYNCSEKLYIGKCNEEEYRTILKFDISKNKIKGKIKKVELSLYLLDLSMKENIKCFMLNISRNIEPVDVREVSYSDAPEFCQQCQIYKIEKCFKKNYLKIDITKIAKSWIKGKGKNFGITLLGLYEDSFMSLYSSRGRKHSCVNIYIEEDKVNCTPPEIEEECSEKNNRHDYNYNYNYEESRHDYKESNRNIYNDNCNRNYSDSNRGDYKDWYGEEFNREIIEKMIEKKVQKEMEKEPIDVPFNHVDKTIDEKKIIVEDKAYGYFYNDNGNIFKCNVGTAVIFNGYCNTKNIELCDYDTGIMIKKAGIYNIDFGVNCRCDSIDTMQIEVNGELAPHTNIQVGLCESMIWGHVILDIDENDTVIKLRLLSTKTLLMIIGIAAAINIVKID